MFMYDLRGVNQTQIKEGPHTSAFEELLRCIAMKGTQLPCYNAGGRVFGVWPKSMEGTAQHSCRDETILTSSDYQWFVLFSDCKTERMLFLACQIMCILNSLQIFNSLRIRNVWHLFQKRNQKQTQATKANQYHLQLQEAELPHNAYPDHHS